MRTAEMVVKYPKPVNMLDDYFLWTYTLDKNVVSLSAICSNADSMVGVVSQAFGFKPTVDVKNGTYYWIGDGFSAFVRSDKKKDCDFKIEKNGYREFIEKHTHMGNLTLERPIDEWLFRDALQHASSYKNTMIDNYINDFALDYQAPPWNKNRDHIESIKIHPKHGIVTIKMDAQASGVIFYLIAMVNGEFLEAGNVKEGAIKFICYVDDTYENLPLPEECAENIVRRSK